MVLLEVMPHVDAHLGLAAQGASFTGPQRRNFSHSLCEKAHARRHAPGIQSAAATKRSELHTVGSEA